MSSDPSAAVGVGVPRRQCAGKNCCCQGGYSQVQGREGRVGGADGKVYWEDWGKRCVGGDR